jgi:hypothetical protein
MLSNLKHFAQNPQEVRKTITALVGSATLLVGAHLLPTAVGGWLTALTPFLVATGVYVVPANDPTTKAV